MEGQIIVKFSREQINHLCQQIQALPYDAKEPVLMDVYIGVDETIGKQTPALVIHQDTKRPESDFPSGVSILFHQTLD
jgi:hypothetical protein